jgi:hypothetical protein
MSLEKSTPRRFTSPASLTSGLAENAAISLEVGGAGPIKKKVQISNKEIDRVAKGLAEVAFSLGQTNNPELFSSQLAEDIVEALKKVKKRQEDRHKKKHS